MAVAQTVIQAEEGILANAQVKTAYAGYTGAGYVDIVDKAGSSVELVFRRTSAATDTLSVFYANASGGTRNLAVTLNDVSIGTLSFPQTGAWTTWSSVNMVVALNSGINRLRFTTTGSSATPNLDRIRIGGQAAVTMYKLTLAKSGNGSVSANPSDTYYDAGTQVTLTASPSGNSIFRGWMGTDEITVNPFTLTLNGHKTEVGVMLDTTGFASFPVEPGPIGFASVTAHGLSGTTGGVGGEEVFITNSTDLWNLMLRRADPNRALNYSPLIVYIAGILSPESIFNGDEMLDVKDVYNISIIGIGNDATITGFGLSIVRSTNIIVRNMKFASCPEDGIGVQADDDETLGHHIWIDHCSFTDTPPPGYPAGTTPDGALDISHTTSFVTVSWCQFTNHDKTSLIGHSDSNTEDVAMKVTYHHNWFNGTVQRHPRIRFATVHVFNNYFANTSLYGVSSNLEADVVVEGCYFLNVPIPTETSRDGSPQGDLVERNNTFVNCGVPGTRGLAFDPLNNL